MMETDKNTRIQILDTKEDAETGAIRVVRNRLDDLAEIAGEQDAEALLVCPAAEGLAGEGIDLVIGVRFRTGLDEDAVFWRQHSLADELHHRLRLEALVLNLDQSFDGYVKNIGPLLATPYRDELGERSAAGPPGI
jgi:hypothetical protein